MTNSGTEIELKLSLVGGRLSRARRLLGEVDRWDRSLIEDVYFDTTDSKLRRRGLVLRLRRDGDRWLQTLKSSSTGRSLVPVRGEWEVALPQGTGQPALDLDRFDIAALRALMRGGLETSALVPVFRSRVVRRRAMVRQGESSIEVALDRGELAAGASGRQRARKVAELELELKSGNAQDLLDVATGVVKARDGVKLVPALRSKAERGYALASGDGLSAERASARGFAELIAPGMSAADALRAVIRHGVAIVVSNADAMRIAISSEHIHQARVALRRMRSAVRLFDPCADDLPASLAQGLHRLAHLLGEARDWDVIVEGTLPAILVSDDSRQGDRAGPLRRAADRQRKRSLKRAIAAVSSTRYARLILRLARWSTTPPPTSEASVADLAPTLLEQAADRLFKDARLFARLGRRKQHRVRIHAKRLRYTLDLLTGALPERGTADYVDALSVLQDSLGELNDVAVAHERLAALASSRDEKRQLETWHRRVRPELVERAAAQITTLDRRLRPWSLIRVDSAVARG